ncbi:MAG: SulP family inorganic anion transporter [Candidatus Hatepunaea meridiana]|nr:SulP family inorganic anion transporter [Candidatus Hatepunaea meridiana]
MLKHISNFLPFLKWFDHYSAKHFRADFISGLTVALVLIPQSMAYAQLAGLPSYYGLYAAFLPPVIAAMFGSSHQLATGPVAVVSLMTATALEPLATAGSEAYIAYAIILALIVGLFQLSLGVLRLGIIVNFLSHPVVNGFTNAAAIIIATSQLSKLFGVDVDKAEHHYDTIISVVNAAIGSTHWPTLILAVLAFLLMYGLKRVNPRIPSVLVAVLVTTLISWAIGFEHNSTTSLNNIESDQVCEDISDLNQAIRQIESNVDKKVAFKDELLEIGENHSIKSKESAILNHQIALCDLRIEEAKEKSNELRAHLRSFHFSAVEDEFGDLKFYLKGEVPEDLKGDKLRWRLKIGHRITDESSITLIGGGAVVGNIPRGLPGITIPELNFKVMLDLLSMAIIISILGFMEAISIAKAMAAKTRQRLNPNQELIGQGLANIFGACGQSYAVSGSFSRSAVNLQAGALTGMSSVFSSVIVVVTLLFLTPLLYHLPQSVLAAVIMMAVVGLLNMKGFIHAWRAQKYDGIITIVTFTLTLAFAPHLDKGIMIGVLLSVGLYLFRNIKPDIAILSRYIDGTYRNSKRFGLKRCKHIAVIRYNNSLFFANVSFIEETVLEIEASMPELKHILLVSNGMNELDASGEAMLLQIVIRMREAGYGISLTGLNDQVRDVLKRTHLYDTIGEDNIFGNVANAVKTIYAKTHEDSDEDVCPLINVCFEEEAKEELLKERFTMSLDSEK